MAGSPERLIYQTLPKEAKDRIGNYYLSELLKLKPEAQNMWSFGDHEIVSFEGFKLPSLLNQQLDLKNLNWAWHPARSNSLTTLLIGGKTKEHFCTMEPKDAVATIEIAHKGIASNRPPSFRSDRLPFYVRVAGINKEQNRIVAATYDLEDQNRLVRLNVSISHQESPIRLDKREDNDYSFETRNKLSTSIDAVGSVYHPYENEAGFITGEMKEMARASELLIFHTYQDNVYPGEFMSEESLSDKEKLKVVSEGMGYLAKRANGMITVGISKDTVEKISIFPWEKGVLKPWEISVPEFLPKA